MVLYCVCVWCVLSSHLFWTSSSLDVPAGATQTGRRSYRISHPHSFGSAVHAFIFLARRIQPFLFLVDREVELCVLITINRILYYDYYINY